MYEFIYENPYASVGIVFAVLFVIMLAIEYFDKPRNNPPEV